MYEVRKYDWRSRDSDSQCAFDAPENPGGAASEWNFSEAVAGDSSAQEPDWSGMQET